MTYHSRPLDEITRDLNRFLADQPESQADIAKKAGVNQSTVSRVQMGEPRARVSKGLRKLCNYANIPIEIESLASPPDPRGNSDLMSALAEVWDGSPAHAKAFARLIRDLKPLLTDRKSR